MTIIIYFSDLWQEKEDAIDCSIHNLSSAVSRYDGLFQICFTFSSIGEWKICEPLFLYVSSLSYSIKLADFYKLSFVSFEGDS